MIPQELARTTFDQYGLAAMGIASGQLAPRWAASAPSFDQNKLSLTFPSAWQCPAGGVLTYSHAGAPRCSGLDGKPIGGDVALVELHVQTYLRLCRLYAARFEGNTTTGRPIRPVLRYVVIKPTSALSDPLSGLGIAECGSELPAGEATFHDARGLIIDPTAVAAQFADLLAAWGALVQKGKGASDIADTSPGSLRAIAQLDGITPKVVVHAVSPHGAPLVDPGSGKSVVLSSGGTRFGNAGPFTWPAGAALSGESTDPNHHLRWGFASEGTLDKAPLSLPTFPSTPIPSGSTAPSLVRDFFRVCVVDLDFHLLGNRSTTKREDVGPRDADAAAEAAPTVRDGSLVRLAPDATAPTIPYDGAAALGAVNEMLQAVTTSGPSSQFLAAVASPAIRSDFALPADRTAASRWPTSPNFAGTAQAWDPTHLSQLRTEGASGISAAWVDTTSKDILLTVAAGVLPAAAHVRVFPRLFVTGPSLSEADTLFRGDGDATIVPASGATQLVLRDPLGLGTLPRPSSPRLRFDLVVVPRPAGQSPRARLFGGFNLLVGTPVGGSAPTSTTNLLAARTSLLEAVCSSPILGLPARPGPSFSISNVSDLVNLVRALASESSPREGPRFPTMGRLDTIVAVRDDGPSLSSWRALLTGGWLAPETRTADYRLGNPGAPATRETHAIAVEVDGPLAHDLGRAALRRCQALPSRLVTLADAKFAEPASPASPSTMAAAVLQTVAPYCETPELALYSGDLTTLPDDYASLVSSVSSFTGGSLPLPTSSGGGDRLVKEVKRELYAARHGRRDAQWALRRAIEQARELIYIEAPAFGPTAYFTRPGGGKSVPVYAWDSATDGAAPSLESHAWDLVSALRDRLASQPNLKLIVAIPREIDFGAQYAGWKQQSYQRRKEVLSPVSGALSAAAPGRVVAFHPVGFPGRPINIRTTSIVVDDVWAMVGTSVPRRRGLTFDGGQDLVCFDRRLREGYSQSIRDFRRQLLGMHLGETSAASGQMPSSGWIRLAHPDGAFGLVKDTLASGGRGLITPLWDGPPTSGAGAVAQQSDDVADPEGRATSALLLMLVSGLADLETTA